MSSMAARNAVAVIKKVLLSGGVGEQEQREREVKVRRNKEGRMRRKSQRERNVFEMTCSPRHDSD